MEHYPGRDCPNVSRGTFRKEQTRFPDPGAQSPSPQGFPVWETFFIFLHKTVEIRRGDWYNEKLHTPTISIFQGGPSHG
ncbi:hypothetical protein AALB19_04595 [Oscillospiraceae bacterium 50-58]